MASSTQLIAKIAPPLVDELLAAQKLVAAHCASVQRTGYALADSTCMEDCLLLYALVRHFGCKAAFEIGTNIGATAVAINSAARRNGGVFTTCDPVNFNVLPPWGGIRFINTRSHIALQMLRDEAHSLDFVFVDWVPDALSIELMSRFCTGDTIVAVHDYSPTEPKGAAVVNALSSEFGGARHGAWITPDAEPCDLGSGLRLNLYTAFFLPSHLL